MDDMMLTINWPLEKFSDDQFERYFDDLIARPNVLKSATRALILGSIRSGDDDQMRRDLLHNWTAASAAALGRLFEREPDELVRGMPVGRVRMAALVMLTDAWLGAGALMVNDPTPVLLRAAQLAGARVGMGRFTAN